LEDLRQQVKELKNADKALRTQRASQIGELREQVKTYANQIQVLALHIGQLQDDNHRLLLRLETAGDNVRRYPATAEAGLVPRSRRTAAGQPRRADRHR
jgi:chromosome segregation ATPase